METLIKSARASRRDTAVAAWAPQVLTLSDEVVESARHVIDNQSTDYTLVRVDEELQLLGKQGQQLRELLAARVVASYTGHPQFEEIQKAVLGEVHAEVKGAESWLGKVRSNLMVANPTWRRRQQPHCCRPGVCREEEAQEGGKKGACDKIWQS